MSSQSGILIRPITVDDSLEELTDLLHRAYAHLAEMGMRFYASHQDVEATRDRVARGECYVATEGDRVIGTITWYREFEHDDPQWYARHDVAYFGQFGVEPSLQGRGIGTMLMEHVERAAHELEFAELALDTAETAHHLIDYYVRHGYRHIQYVQWRGVNYRSVVMSKILV